METVNKKLCNFEKVSTIVVNKNPWTVEIGLVTPTLKVKRGQMNKKFGQKLLDWQDNNDKVIFEN